MSGIQLKKKFKTDWTSGLPKFLKEVDIMIKKSLAIAFLFIASVVWSGDRPNPGDVKWDTKEEKEAHLKEAKIKAIQEEIKIKSEKWQHDLKSGPVGRFQAVAMGQSGVIILDTKEGLVWAADATAETGPKIVYVGQVSPYPRPGS
jgi:hypothetical protein